MRTPTILIAAVLVTATLVPQAQAADPLVEANRATLIEMLGDDYDPDALDSSDPTDRTPRTMAEAVDEAARMLAGFGIDLERVASGEEEAGPGSFPIVTSAAGFGLVVELGVWIGSLPVRCSDVHLHDLPLPHVFRQLLTTPLSHSTQLNLAFGADATGTLVQTVSYSGTDVYMVGERVENGCVEFQVCIFGVCVLSFLAHVGLVIAGVITNDPTMVGALSLVHDAAEPLL